MRTRKKPRKAITLPARYYTGHGTPVDVLLTDLSEDGCRLAIGAARLAPGTPIQVAVAGAGTYPGIVRWCVGGEAGVTFLQTLDEAELARLQNTHSPLAPGEEPEAQFQPMRQPPLRFC